MDFLHLVLLGAAQLITAGAIYGGIRADLRNMRERMAATERAADLAHSRIDRILERNTA